MLVLAPVLTSGPSENQVLLRGKSRHKLLLMLKVYNTELNFYYYYFFNLFDQLVYFSNFMRNAEFSFFSTFFI